MTARVSLVAFDLDGTLVDSLRDIAESTNDLLRECGGRTHGQDAIGRMVGDGAATLVARAFASAGVVPPPDALERFLAIYNARLLRFTRPYDGIHDLLRQLGAVATLAVLTNKPLAATRFILDELELAPFFGPRVIGGDGPYPRKPDPAGLVHLSSMAGAQGATLMVGDSPVDLRTARAAGARSCVAAYGFGVAGFEPAELSRADYVIAQPLDLLAVL